MTSLTVPATQDQVLKFLSPWKIILIQTTDIQPLCPTGSWPSHEAKRIYFNLKSPIVFSILAVQKSEVSSMTHGRLLIVTHVKSKH